MVSDQIGAVESVKAASDIVRRVLPQARSLIFPEMFTSSTHLYREQSKKSTRHCRQNLGC